MIALSLAELKSYRYILVQLTDFETLPLYSLTTLHKTSCLKAAQLEISPKLTFFIKTKEYI